MKTLRDKHKLAFFLITSIGLSSCSSFTYKWSYNSLDIYLHYKVNSYFDLKSSQSNAVKQNILKFLARHREEGLKDFIVVFNRLKKGVKQGLRSEDLLFVREKNQKHWESIASWIIDDTVNFLTSLDAGQLRHCKEKLESDNEELAELANKPKNERIKQSTRNILKILEYFYGSFSDEQEKDFFRFNKNLADITPLRLQFRKKRYMEFISLLDKEKDKQKLKKTLKYWLFNIELSRPPFYKKKMDQYHKQFMEAILYANSTLATKEQKKNAVGKFNELLRITRELQGAR
ncbi:MAG: hypothetical protein GY754_08115 [bacterium]|nr:hypothetical protein [bacterium]